MIVLVALYAACAGRTASDHAAAGGSAGFDAQQDRSDSLSDAIEPSDTIADVARDSAPFGAACDVFAQNCTGTTPKCSLVRAPGDGGSPATLVAACVNDPGAKGELEPCSLYDPGSGEWSDPSAVGHDDCQAGLFCAVAGLWGNAIRKTGYCRPFCVSYADCSAPSSFCTGAYCDWTPDAAGGI